MKNFYSLNKKCSNCPTAIANQNQRGLCRPCYIAMFKIKKRDHIADYHKKKYVSNKKEINAKIKIRLHTDPNYKLRDLLRSRIRHLIKKSDRHSHIDHLGCSVSQLKSYLESKFQVGMTWENHGRYGWHVDHIKPLASFDLTDIVQFAEACHYTNLQPLWAKDNLAKSSKR